MRRPEGRVRRAASVRAALVFLLLAVVGGTAMAQGQGFAERFDTAWNLVATRYWHIERTGVDWQAVRDAYRPRALAATDDAGLYEVLEEMYSLLGDDHSVFVPPAKVAKVRAEYGDLPCIMVLGSGATLPALNQALAAGSWNRLLRLQADGYALSGEGHVANVSYGLTDGGVGYVRLPDLASDGAAEAVRVAVTDLEAAGAWSLVLDLRGNPGGRLVTMMQVAGVFTRGFLWRAITSWTLPMPYPAIGLAQTDLPLAVLIDGGVNSAAEGLAGALQLRGRATVFGEQSAGNVEALLPFCLRDGSQAWIATGVLAPIGGPTWEGRGVVPDVESSSATALDAAIAYLIDQREE